MTVDGLRIGHGYDVHRFAPSFDEKNPLVLAGVRLPEARTLEAHSDGDLVLHAVCDAILGALGQGDIGQHFPDDDPQFAFFSLRRWQWWTVILLWWIGDPRGAWLIPEQHEYIN